MLTAKELADEMGVTFKTVYNWVERGAPCYRKPHGLRMVLRFDLDEVEAWIEKQRKGEAV